jgi:hypothetical protein
LNDNRAAFINGVTHPGVAMVWSFPSMMWRDFQPFRIEPGWGFDPPPFSSKPNLLPGLTPYRYHYGVTTLLDEMHIQHDFLMFGHPELLSDEALKSLRNYGIILLPCCPCLSDRQAKALRSWAAAGGKIVKIGDVGIRDENYNLRKKPALAGIPMVDLLTQRDAALKIIGRGTDVTTDAPERVSINIWRVMGGKGLTVHLVDYGSAGVVDGKPNLTKPISVSFPLPEGVSIDTAIMLKPCEDSETIPYTVADGRISFTVPPFNGYRAIVLCKESDYYAENKAAKDRIARDKENVKAERLRLRKLYGTNGKS